MGAPVRNQATALPDPKRLRRSATLGPVSTERKRGCADALSFPHAGLFRRSGTTASFRPISDFRLRQIRLSDAAALRATTPPPRSLIRNDSVVPLRSIPFPRSGSADARMRFRSLKQDFSDVAERQRRFVRFPISASARFASAFNAAASAPLRQGLRTPRIETTPSFRYARSRFHGGQFKGAKVLDVSKGRQGDGV